MTLTRLLEIDQKFLQDVERRSMEFAEAEYRQLGSPQEPAALVVAIETILTRSTVDGIGYARVLLKRKKDLERGTWKPRQAPIAPTTPAKAGSCEVCGGTGYRQILGGSSGTLCECGAWKKREGG